MVSECPWQEPWRTDGALECKGVSPEGRSLSLEGGGRAQRKKGALEGWGALKGGEIGWREVLEG